MGKNPHFGDSFDIFCQHVCIQSLKVLWNFIYVINSILSNTSQKTACPGKIWFCLYCNDQTPFFETWLFFRHLCCVFSLCQQWCSNLNDFKFGRDLDFLKNISNFKSTWLRWEIRSENWRSTPVKRKIYQKRFMSMIRHNSCVFSLFLSLLKKFFKGSHWIFT